MKIMTNLFLFLAVMWTGWLSPPAHSACIADDGNTVRISCDVYITGSGGTTPPPPGITACVGYTYTTGACTFDNTAPVVGHVGIPAGCIGGVVPSTSVPCIYTPPVNIGYYSELAFGAGLQSRTDTIDIGEIKFYTFTVPAGVTEFSMNVSSLNSQTENLDMVLIQSASGVPTSYFDRYFTDAYAYYNSDIGLWGTPWFRAYPEGPVWAGFAASIPGRYFVAVRNAGPDSGRYYVYVK